MAGGWSRRRLRMAPAETPAAFLRIAHRDLRTARAMADPSVFEEDSWGFYVTRSASTPSTWPAAKRCRRQSSWPRSSAASLVPKPSRPLSRPPIRDAPLCRTSGHRGGQDSRRSTFRRAPCRGMTYSTPQTYWPHRSADRMKPLWNENRDQSYISGTQWRTQVSTNNLAHCQTPYGAHAHAGHPGVNHASPAPDCCPHARHCRFRASGRRSRCDHCHSRPSPCHG